MRTYIFLIVLIILCVSVYAQEKQEKIPILFDTTYIELNATRKPICIIDSTVLEPTKLLIRCSINFAYPLCDSTQTITVVDFKLYNIMFINLNNNKRKIIDRYDKMTAEEIKIWDRYYKLLKYWYLNQPYEKMFGRMSETEKLVYFSCVLTINPFLPQTCIERFSSH